MTDNDSTLGIIGVEEGEEICQYTKDIVALNEHGVRVDSLQVRMLATNANRLTRYVKILELALVRAVMNDLHNQGVADSQELSLRTVLGAKTLKVSAAEYLNDKGES